MENRYKVGDRVTFQECNCKPVYKGTVEAVDSHDEIRVKFDGEDFLEELYSYEVEPLEEKGVES